MNIGVIGYGSMGKMITEKLASSDLIKPQEIYVSNRTPEKLEDVPEGVIACRSNREVAHKSEIVFLCVRPNDLRRVLLEISSNLKEESIVVSLNGSVPFHILGHSYFGKICKVIPSVTAEVDRSQTLVCYNELVEDEDKAKLREILEVFGNVIELPEDELGMGSELVSCMPGFIASIFDVLCSSAQKHTSIPKKQVVKMVLETMCATGELMLSKDMSFEDVVERVATKGGITEEGTKVVYEGFPEIADLLFEKTLEKRHLTAENAQASFEKEN